MGDQTRYLDFWRESKKRAIFKGREAITPFADPELGKSDLTNFGNLVTLLWYIVEEGNGNLETHVQNGL